MKIVDEMPIEGRFVEIVETDQEIVCSHLKWEGTKLFCQHSDFSWFETKSEPVSTAAKYIVKD